jgi:hypothetical protein
VSLIGPKPDGRAALQNRAKADIEIRGTAFLASGIQSRQLAALWHPARLAALATLIYDARPVSPIFKNLQGRGSAYRTGSPQANTVSTSSLAFGREPCEPIVRRTLLVMGFAGRAELGAECEASSGRPFRKFDLVYLRTDKGLGQFTRAGRKQSSDSLSPRVDRAKVPVGTLIRKW